MADERQARREYRLPTEAEWEYACRAGTKTKYCFGDDETGLGDFGWFEANASGETHPVGRKKPNAWGLFDMHGNVWEWCSDWEDDYPIFVLAPGRDTYPVVSDPQGPSRGYVRVHRGGSWRDVAGIGRSANRSWDNPSFRDNNRGFRLALSLRGMESPEAGAAK